MTRESATPGRRYGVCLALIVFVALAWRVGHARSVLGYPLTGTLVQDAAYYDAEAQRLLAGLDSSTGGPSFMSSGYPHAVAAVYRVLGARPATMLWVQAVLGAVTSLLVALAALRLGGDDTTSLCAGLLHAVYAGSVFYGGLLLTPELTNLLLALMLLGLAVHLQRGGWLSTAGAGLALGGAVLVRANNLLLLPVLVAVLLTLGGEIGTLRSARRWHGAATFAALALAVSMPVIAYNGMVHGEWVPVSSNGGVNFWIGNNRQAEGVYFAADFVPSLAAGGEQLGFLAEARRRSGSPGLTPAAGSAFWFREGLREIRSAPWRWLRIEGRKVALFWNRFETKTNVSMEFMTRFSPWLRLSLGFGPLAVAGLAGLTLLVAERRLRFAWVVGSLVLVPLATCVMFFVSGEYRHPAALALCITAGVAVVHVGRVILRRERPGWRVLAAAVLALPLVFYPFPTLARVFHPRLDYSNYSRALIRTEPGTGAAFEPRYRQALELLEQAPPAWRDDLFVGEARLNVSCLAALRLRDPAWARTALAEATALARRDLRPPQREYPERFLVLLGAALRDCVGRLASQTWVLTDPELDRAAREVRQELTRSVGAAG